jgi:Na+-driven multidrug efflux pump
MATLLLALVGYRMGWAWPRIRALGEILRIGFPSSITGAFFCFIYIVITPTAAAYGPSALAALGVGHRIESFSYLVSHGLALASITLVGQHLGAGSPQQAFRAACEACRLVSYFMLLSTVVLVAAAEPLVQVFSDDPEVVERATLYLQWMSLAQWATGLAVVLEGVMAGAGRPLLTMVVSTGAAASRWPATTWGSRAWGLSGIWSALVIARWLEALLCLFVFLKSSVWRPAIDRKGQDSL